MCIKTAGCRGKTLFKFFISADHEAMECEQDPILFLKLLKCVRSKSKLMMTDTKS